MINKWEPASSIEQLIILFRNKYFWIPLYAFLLSLLVIRKQRRVWIYILAIALCVFIADSGSSQLIKPAVERLRPCKAIPDLVNIRIRCGSGYSFPSAHATNHFALAILMMSFFTPLERKYKLALLLWASLIAFGQVFVGVHYPIDVFCGALLGILIGYGISKIVLILEAKTAS